MWLQGAEQQFPQRWDSTFGGRRRLWFIPSGWQKVAGGRSAAETSGCWDVISSHPVRDARSSVLLRKFCDPFGIESHSQSHRRSPLRFDLRLLSAIPTGSRRGRAANRVSKCCSAPVATKKRQAGSLPLRFTSGRGIRNGQWRSQKPMKRDCLDSRPTSACES